MGKTYPEIDDKLREWIAAQKMFFVATAPLGAEGLVNCSPKGLDSFRVLGPQSVAYLDYTGSGIETTAHLRENGRITFMFCAYEGPPKILRLYGRGEMLEKGTPGFDELLPQFTPQKGVRGIIRATLHRIQDSCGWGVPLYDYQGDRTTLTDVCESKGEDWLTDYRTQKNLRSLDGLTGLTVAVNESGAGEDGA